MDEEGTSHLVGQPTVVVVVACKEDMHLRDGGKEAHARMHSSQEVADPVDTEDQEDSRKEAKAVGHHSSQGVVPDCRTYRCSDAGR